MASKRIKDWLTSITVFRTGDVIPVDGPSGTAKMAKDDLLKVTAQNALAGNVAQAFDPTRSSNHPYLVGESVVYEGKEYTFKNEHYGVWNASDVEQKPTDAFVKVPEFLFNTNVTADAVVTNDSYMDSTGTVYSSPQSKIIKFDVTGIKAIRFSGVFYSGVYQMLLLDSNNSVLSYESIYPRNSYVTVDRDVNKADSVVFNVSKSSSFEAFSGSVSYDGAGDAIIKNKEKVKESLENCIAPAFDPTRSSNHPYLVGESVVYEGKEYTFKNEHYGVWNASDVEQKPTDAFVKNIVFDFADGADITSDATVYNDKYMYGSGSFGDSVSSKVVRFDVSGFKAIRFSGVFYSGVYQIIYLNENGEGIDREYIYPRGELVTVERVVGAAKYVALNVPKNSSFEAKSGNAYYEGTNFAVARINGKVDSRTLFSGFRFTTDITDFATITNGKYMMSNGSLVDAAQFMTVEFSISGFDSVEFRGFFLTGAYDMIQLDAANHVIVTRSYGRKNAVVVWDVQLNPLATRLVFNCRIGFNFTCMSGSAVQLPILDRLSTLISQVSDNSEQINKFVSPYNKGHDIGDVPADAYKGYLDDYTWGNASTTYSEVITKFDTLLTPNYSYKESLGTASDGSTLYVYKFTPKKVSAPEGFTKGLPGILIICAQHGFEKGSTFGTWHLLNDVINNFEKNELLRYLRNNVNIYVVPVANPYGFDRNEYNNANNVNLNRNWWVPNWQKHNSEQDPSQNSGDAPFDQPETAAMRDFVLAHLDGIDYVIDYHTNGMSNVTTLENVNWISIANYDYFGDAYSDKINTIAINHCQKANGIIREIAGDTLLGISGVEGENVMCCHITQGSSFPTTGFAPSYCITQGIMGSTLEGCNGFINGDAFCDEVKQTMAAILACWVQQTLFNFSKS